MNITPVDRPIQIDTPVRFSDDLPDSVDVVVIGGGVTGVFTALFAARAGLKVLICEKGRIAGEQSSRNWGWIRQQGRDEAELPIMMEASRLWEEMDNKVKGRTGFHRGGVCHLASSESDLETRSLWVETAKKYQLDTRILSKAEVGNLFDQGSAGNRAHQWVGATYTPSDARAEPWQAVPAVAELAQNEGVLIRENCAVRKLDIEVGQIKGVVTETGRVKTEQVVLAGGAWSSLFARSHGISFPQLSVRSTVSQTAPMQEVFSGNANDKGLAFRRREDGGYTLSGGDRHDLYIGPDAFRGFFKYLPVLKENIEETYFKLKAPKDFPDAWGTMRDWGGEEVSPFERMRVLDPKPNLGQVEMNRKRFAERFPELGKPTIVNAWAGMIDCLPDVVPIIDRAPNLEGLVIATGMSGHGFGIGPGFGKIIAEMLGGKQPGHDMKRFRFSRFTDGSKLMPGPSI